MEGSVLTAAGMSIISYSSHALWSLSLTSIWASDRCRKFYTDVGKKKWGGQNKKDMVANGCVKTERGIKVNRHVLSLIQQNKQWYALIKTEANRKVGSYRDDYMLGLLPSVKLIHFRRVNPDRTFFFSTSRT